MSTVAISDTSATTAPAGRSALWKSLFVQVLAALLLACCACGLVAPLVGLAYFPRTDPGQFVINLKAPTGTRIEITSLTGGSKRGA